MLDESSDHDASVIPGKGKRERRLGGRSLDHHAIKGRFGEAVQESLSQAG